MSEKVDAPARREAERIRQERVVEIRRAQPGPIIILTSVLLMLTIIGFPIALLLFSTLAVRKVTLRQEHVVREAKSGLSAFIGSSPRYMDVTWRLIPRRGVTASGVAYADGRIFVVDDGVAAELPWSVIRSWRWSIDSYQTTELIRGDLSDKMKVAMMNARSQQEAQRNSGLFISVRDVEKPEWHFASADERVLKKWDEILTQMNSGDLPAR